MTSLQCPTQHGGHTHPVCLQGQWGAGGKSWPWECPLMKKNLQAYKVTFVWNVGVLKSSSVCCSPLVWISSAEAAGMMQKCEQRPFGVPKLQGN